MTNNRRDSSFELLRIVAMLMIIITHLIMHCVKVQLTDIESIERMNNGFFCNPLFYKKLFLVQGLYSIGYISNAIFVIVSGYFMADKETIRVFDIAAKLLKQLAFSVAILVVSSNVYFHFIRKKESTRFSLRTILDFNSSSWYVGYYFLIIILAAFFLNDRLKKLNELEYRTFLITVFAIISFVWTGDMLEALATGLRTLLAGVFLYSLGGYIKKYDPFRKIRFWALCAIALLVYVLIYISYYNNVQNSIRVFLIDRALKSNSEKGGEVFIQPIFGFNNSMVVPVILAIIMFEMFRRIRIPNNSIINFIASSTFMIYLIHDNNFWRYIWREIDWIKVLYYSPAAFCVKIAEWTVIVFFAGLLSYVLYLGAINMWKRLCRIAMINDP